MYMATVHGISAGASDKFLGKKEERSGHTEKSTNVARARARIDLFAFNY